MPQKRTTLLAALKRYKAKYGNCNVPMDYEVNPRLGKWVKAIRASKHAHNKAQRRANQASQYIYDELNKLGFDWSYQKVKSTATWNAWIEKLTVFKARFKHCNVETGWEEDTQLAGWVSRQRILYKKGKLSAAQVRRMDELGFVWEWNKLKAQETWMKWYRELETYTQEHGSPQVPRTHANTKLANWVWIQRQRRKGTLKHNGIVGLMTSEQVSLLDKLGFPWDARGE